MDTIETILSRRSIRKYKTDAILPDKVELLLKAAMYAPSARNYQPWHFLVIDDREILNKITEVHPYAQMLKEAPLAILVCGDKTIEPIEGYLSINCSAATQNLLIAAKSIGLGTVWLGVFPRRERIDKLSLLFNLPSHIIPVSLIAIGYPDESPTQPDRFLKDRIHNNLW